ncbi:hypothetical protein TNCV_102851 [Trichonephila clavipes]|nr:hypothetical protein TNCV_102851 [Trichonephila clavipes]
MIGGVKEARPGDLKGQSEGDWISFYLTFRISFILLRRHSIEISRAAAPQGPRDINGDDLLMTERRSLRRSRSSGPGSYQLKGQRQPHPEAEHFKIF